MLSLKITSLLVVAELFGQLLHDVSTKAQIRNLFSTLEFSSSFIMTLLDTLPLLEFMS